MDVRTRAVIASRGVSPRVLRARAVSVWSADLLLIDFRSQIFCTVQRHRILMSGVQKNNHGFWDFFICSLSLSLYKPLTDSSAKYNIHTYGSGGERKKKKWTYFAPWVFRAPLHTLLCRLAVRKLRYFIERFHL